MPSLQPLPDSRARGLFLAALVAAAWAVLGAAVRPARADGAFPDGQAVLLPSDCPRQIVLAATFGLVFSEDDGATWSYACEAAATRNGRLYSMGPAPDHRLFAVSDVGAALSTDDACSWSLAGGVLDGVAVGDLFADPVDPATVMALATPPDVVRRPVSVFRSNDGGATYQDLIFEPPPMATVTGVEVATVSPPKVVYVTFHEGPGTRPRLARSDDGGAHFTTFDLEPSLGQVIPALAAVDPVDSRKVYLLLTGTTADMRSFNALAITTDGGTLWSVPLTVIDGRLTAFIRRQDAAGTLLAAAIKAGQPLGFRSDDGGRTFADWTIGVRARGFGERGGTLFVAADNFMDGFALGSSDDGGATWTRRLEFHDISSVRACVRESCQLDCDYLAGLTLFPPETCNPPPGAGGRGGAGGSGGGGGGGGCSVARDGASGSATVATLSFLALAAARVRRRRRRRGTGGGFVSTAALAAGMGLAASVGGCGREIPRYSLDAGFGSADPPAISFAGRIVTTNNGDDSLSAVDPLSADAPPLRVPVGLAPVEPEGPHHISAAPDGAFVYVNLSEAVLGGGSGPHGAHGNGTTPGFVLKLGTADGRMVAKVGVETNPGDNVLSADGATLYVSHYDLAAWTMGAIHGDIRHGDSKLVAIDTAQMEVLWKLPVCPASHGIRLSADGQTLFAACGPDEIAVVDLAASPPSSRRVALPGLSEGAGCTRCPYALGVAPDGAVWVASLGPASGRNGDGGIDVYLSQTGAFDPARRIDLRGGRAMFPSFAPAPVPAPDGSGDGAAPAAYRAYVPEQGPAGDWLRAYDVAADGAATEVSALAFDRETCFNAHMMLIDTSAAPVGYLICEGDHSGPGSLVVIDLAGPSVVRSVALGVFPDGMAMVPPGPSQP